MRSIELKRRVARLCEGDFRNEDLTRLFLVLREHSFGAATIRELGDFVAHSDTRTKGVTTDGVREFFDTLRLIIPNIDAQLDIYNLPDVFPRAMRANLRRLDNAIIKRDSGLKRAVAEAVLSSALTKLRPKADGRLQLHGRLTQQEVSILQCCSQYIVSRPAFTADQLIKEFRFALLKNNLLEPAQVPSLSKNHEPLVLYAIAAMHQTEILLDDKTRAHLRAGVHEGLLQVTAIADCPLKDGSVVLMASPIFTTNLRAVGYCDPSLPQDNSTWSAAVEVDRTKKLVPL